MKREDGRRRAADPAYREKKARQHRLRKYGLSAEDFAEMVFLTGGVCVVCGSAAALRIDHDHATGRVRALLCHHCNTTLGHVSEDPERLRALAAYVEAA